MSGVAALIASRYLELHGREPRPSGIAAVLERTADPQACPTSLPDHYDLVTSGIANPLAQPQTCEGNAGHNSWFGSGEVDAANAATNARD